MVRELIEGGGAARPVEVADLGPLEGRVLVDATNPLNASFTGLATERSAAEELRDLAPGAKVVKAFNTVFASRLTQPSDEGTPLDAYVAGDDAEATERVATFARSLGFRPVEVGGLQTARYLEGMAFLNITLNARLGWPWQTGWKLVGPTA